MTPFEKNRSMPPPIPAEAMRQKITRPPPIPQAARKPREAVVGPVAVETLQSQKSVRAFEVQGFSQLAVFGTMEKKNSRTENEPNEDALLMDPETGLLGVADGMGGHSGGAMASRTIVKNLPRLFKNKQHDLGDASIQVINATLKNYHLKRLGAFRPTTLTDRSVVDTQVEELSSHDPNMAMRALALLKAITDANDAVQKSGGLTALCTGFVHTSPDGTRYAVVANVGDSGAFKRRSSGEIIPLTEEDSLINVLMEQGILTPDRLRELKANPDQTIPLGSRKLHYKDLKISTVAALGQTSPLYASLYVRRMVPGDELWFASDGMIDKFEDPITDATDTRAIQEAMNGEKTIATRLDRIREAAAKRKTLYKETDDIALVGAQILSSKM